MEYYENPEPLRVLDIRFLQMIIPTLLSNRTEPLDSNKLEWFKIPCATFGGCSAARQIQLLKEIVRGKPFPFIQRMEQFYYTLPTHPRQTQVSPIEPMGVRVGITDLDYYVIETLKIVFHQLDGFIAPNLYTPAYNQGKENNMYPELILFHPRKCLIQLNAPPDLSTLQVITLESILQPRMAPVFEPAKYANQLFIQKGDMHPTNDMSLWEEREDFLIRLKKSRRMQKKYQHIGTTLIPMFKTIATINDANCNKWPRI